MQFSGSGETAATAANGHANRSDPVIAVVLKNLGHALACTQSAQGQSSCSPHLGRGAQLSIHHIVRRHVLQHLLGAGERFHLVIKGPRYHCSPRIMQLEMPDPRTAAWARTGLVSVRHAPPE